MYAIVRNGGKQLKVREGDTILVDTPGLEAGEGYSFDKVLLYSDEAGGVRVGSPVLDDVTVTGTVLGEAVGPKLTVFKYRRRKSSQTTRGHRQHYSRVRVVSIEARQPQGEAPEPGAPGVTANIEPKTPETGDSNGT